VPRDTRDTVWILGDQLNRAVASLAGTTPATTRVLLVESAAKLASKRWHRQRLHVVLASIRRFADELRAAGFEVDHRRAPTFADGLARHRRSHRPRRVRVMEPMSWTMLDWLRRQDVELARSNQFLCHRDEFAAWAGGRPRLRMEEFYRWQRRRLGYLMDGEAPAGGRWNYDRENRKPPPRGAAPWPQPPRARLDEVDRAVLADLPRDVFGAPPDGTWATSRAGALARLRHFVAHSLPGFGPHQDAMTTGSWHLAHALLSPYLNLGLLHPREVCDAAEAAYRSGAAPLASVEGFIRQLIGWREYVWGVYWLWMPGYRRENRLAAARPLPPAFRDATRTRMRCLAETVRGIEARGYAHHIQRLMLLGNLGLLAGVEPTAMVDWMWASFVDGAEWVMLPNVIGMALHADGGRMMTKPYAAGGAYVDRMGDYCRGCPYDPKRRTGDDACPFTTLYWAFLDRHRARFAGNHRLRVPLSSLDRLGDLPAVRTRAAEVLARLDAGTL
jgi:deoxyribodipyrimidine photolyase-related protein